MLSLLSAGCAEKGRRGKSRILQLDRRAKHKCGNSLTYIDRFLEDTVHTIQYSVKYCDQLETLYWECCRAKVHFLYIAYSRRMERSICLHMANVISICDSLSPVGHFCSLLIILLKADVSEILKDPVHLGGWTVITLPKTESTPRSLMGWGFLIIGFSLAAVPSCGSAEWPGNSELVAAIIQGM